MNPKELTCWSELGIFVEFREHHYCLTTKSAARSGLMDAHRIMRFNPAGVQ
jgi:hypothetical protein